MNEKKYRDLFIDFDDTIYDTYGNANMALREVYKELNLGERLNSEEEFYDRYWRTNIELWGQYGRGEIKRSFLIVERFRRPLAETAKDDGAWVTEEYCMSVSDLFLQRCVKSGVIKGAHELIDYLKGKGYRMHICSNGFHEVQYKKLKTCGMDGKFENVILSEDAGANKPSPVFFDYALKTTGASRETTLMIGDNYNSDILGAMNSGIDALLFNRWQINDLSTRPTFVADRLEEIMHIL